VIPPIGDDCRDTAVRHPDAALVRTARTGDTAALAALMEQTYPALTRFCTRLVGSGTAQDLAQETVFRAVAALDDLRDPRRFSAWLFGIATNVARRW
jgi:DNA-directed RNA polymerase specialized sigma24 family protein